MPMKDDKKCICLHSRDASPTCPVHGGKNPELSYEEWRQRRMIELWQGYADEDHE